MGFLSTPVLNTSSNAEQRPGLVSPSAMLCSDVKSPPLDVSRLF